MPDWIAIVLRPLALVVLLFVALLVSRMLARVIPEGRIKDLLYKQHEIVPRDPASVSPTTRRVCTAILLVLAAWIAIVQLTK